jgi:putrescine transport system ATP-binding protein
VPPPSIDPVISIQNVAKAFGAVRAVDNVSLDIAPNEFLALLGASGCGKTTLLRLIAGLERCDSGKILIDGADMTAVEPYRRPVNLMFQSYALFPHMTVAGNVAFGLQQEGIKGADLSQRVNESLALVEMAGHAERKPHQLSGGQRQRVALARALAKRPKVLLLDEPMAALDRALRERTRLELMNLRKRLGISFVVVTHDQEDAMTMADRVAIMDHGKIVQLDSPRTLYERPATRAVADFFGEANIWDGAVTANARIAVPVLGLDVRVPGALPAAGQKVAIAVRPERIALDPVPKPDDNALADGIVEDIVYLGTVSTYLVRVPHGGLIRVTRQNDGGGVFARGARVSITWPAAAVVVLAS